MATCGTGIRRVGSLTICVPRIDGNQERDRVVNSTLRDEGWTVLRIWEDEIRSDLEECAARVLRAAGR